MTTEMDLTRETNNANKEIAASTNQSNKDIAQMNNEFNLNMLDKQIEYNKQAYAQQRDDSIKFWQMQNEYNTPSKQMERLEQAGVNPYMAMGAISSGSASAAPQSSQMQGITTPTASPYSAVGYTAQKPDINARLQVIQQVLGGINDVIGNVYEGRVNQAAVAGMRMDNEYNARSLGARVGSALAGAEGAQLQNAYQRVVNGYTPALMNNQLTAGYLSNVGQSITNAMLDTNLEFLPLQQRMQIGTYVADMRNKIMQGDIYGKQIQEYQQRIIGLMEDNRGKKFTNDQNERLKEYLDTTIQNAATPDWRSNPVGAIRGVSTIIGESVPDTVPGTNKIYGRTYGRQDTLKNIPWYLRY